MKKLMFLLSFGLLIFMLFACSKKIVIDQINFNDDNAATEVELSKFNLSDYKLTIIYSDDTSKVIDVTRAMLSDEDYAKLSTLGTHSVMINYEGFTLAASFTLYETVTITVNPAGGVLTGPSTITIRKGETLASLPMVTKGDLEFLGWKLADGSGFTNDTVVNSDITIIAEWNDIYKIELNENTVPTEILKGNFSLYNIVLVVTYDNGRTDEVNVTSDMLSSEDNAKLDTLGTHTITINYLGKTFTCTFTLYEEVLVTIQEQGGFLVGPSTLVVRKGSTLNPLPEISKDGVEFIGWKLEDGTPFTTDTIINDNIMIFAHWKDIQTISLDASIINDDLVFGVFELGDFKLNIVYLNGEEETLDVTEDMLSADDYNSLSTPGNKSIVITYKNFNASVNFKLLAIYTVTFNANGGQLVGDTSVEVVEGKKLVALPQVNRDDYDFLDWQTADGKSFSLDTIITKDIEIKAIWDDVPNSQKAKFNYYYLEELEIKEVYKSILVSKDNKFYVPYGEFNDVYNEETREVHQVFIDINDYFMEVLEVGEEIEDILYADIDNIGMVIRTSNNNYYGYFFSNLYGQYGLGHNEAVQDGITRLFTEISFNDGEEIITVYVNYTYNIAVTNQNRVFFTGKLGNDYPIYNTPEEITNQFDLAADERFLSDMELAETVSIYGSQAIYTNKRVFGFDAIFTGIDTSGKDFIDLIEIFGEELLFILPADNDGVSLYVTKSGKVRLIELTGYQIDVIDDIPLNKNETLISCSFQGIEYGYLIFKTSNNRFILFSIENPEMTYTSDILPESIGVINNIYMYEYLVIIENSDGDLYYVDGEVLKDEIFLYDFSTYSNLDNPEIHISNLGFYYFLYIISDGDVYEFYDGELSKNNIVGLNKQVVYYKKGNEVILPEYDLGDYRIDGWTVDFESALEDEIIALENLDIYPLLPTIRELNIIISFDDFYDDLGYLYVIEGEKLSSDFVTTFIIEYFENNDIVYGNISNYLIYDYANDRVFDFDNPISEDNTLVVILDDNNLIPVSIAYYDEDGEVIGYDQVYVASGGTIEDFYLDFSFDNKYRISEYYLDLNELSFDPNTPIYEGLYLDIVLVYKEIYNLTIVLPDGIDNLEFNIFENLEFPENEFNQLIYEIEEENNYRFDSLYLDDAFTKLFNPDRFDANKDIILYAKLVEGNQVLLRFYHEGEELKQFQRTEIIFLGGYLDHLSLPNGYEIKDCFIDEEMTNKIENYNDLKISVLYIELVEDGRISDINFIFPQLNSLEYHYYAPSLDDYTTIIKVIKDVTGNYLYEYDWYLYSDINLENRIDYHDLDNYGNVYVYFHSIDQFNKITINYLDSEFESVDYFLPTQFTLYNETILHPLYKLMDNYIFTVLKVFTDAAGTEEFNLYDSSAYSDGLQLYVSFSMNELEPLTIQFLDGPIIVMNNEDYNASDIIYKIEEYFDTIAFYDYSSEKYYINLFCDEEFTTPFNDYTGYDEIVLYGKLERVEKATITIEFINDGYEPISFKYSKGKSLYEDSYQITDRLCNKYQIEYGEYLLYKDSDLNQQFYSHMITEDTTIYAKLRRKINILFPQSLVNNEYILLNDDEELNEFQIISILQDFDNNYIYQITLYTDFSMTEVYSGNTLENGDYLFIDFIATEIEP